MSEALLLGVAIFAGALVSGLAGFAFSAAAGAILLHVLSPQEGVPLMMACSIAVQSASLVWLRQVMNWRASALYFVGGALGLVPALYLLTRVDPVKFRICFGLFLLCYSIYMLARPGSQILRRFKIRVVDGLVGFTGGLIGGLPPCLAPHRLCGAIFAACPKNNSAAWCSPTSLQCKLSPWACCWQPGTFRRNSGGFCHQPASPRGRNRAWHLPVWKNDELTFRRLVLVALLVWGLSFVLS